MPFQFNLSALTESARAHLLRRESPRGELRGRLFSPGGRGASSAPSSFVASTPPPLGSGIGAEVAGSAGVEVGLSGESLSVVAVGVSLSVFVCRRSCVLHFASGWLAMGSNFALWEVLPAQSRLMQGKSRFTKGPCTSQVHVTRPSCIIGCPLRI
jgi:hypothetical protein